MRLEAQLDQSGLALRVALFATYALTCDGRPARAKVFKCASPGIIRLFHPIAEHCLQLIDDAYTIPECLTVASRQNVLLPRLRQSTRIP